MSISARKRISLFYTFLIKHGLAYKYNYYLKRNGGNKEFLLTCNNLHKLIHPFLWSDTYEGFSFWDNIFEKWNNLYLSILLKNNTYWNYERHF